MSFANLSDNNQSFGMFANLKKRPQSSYQQVDLVEDSAPSQRKVSLSDQGSSPAISASPVRAEVVGKVQDRPESRNLANAAPVSRNEGAMTQRQVRDYMAPSAEQTPRELNTPRSLMGDFLREQMNKAQSLASGDYSPSRTAMQEYAKQLAAQTQSVGLTDEGSSSSRANRRSARAAVPGALQQGMIQAGATDKLRGIGMMQDILGGQANLAGSGMGQAASELAYEDWLATTGAQLRAQGLSNRLAEEESLLQRQLQFKQAGMPGLRYNASVQANDYAQDAARTGQMIAGFGNLVQGSFGMYPMFQGSQGYEGIGNTTPIMGAPDYTYGGSPWFLGD